MRETKIQLKVGSSSVTLFQLVCSIGWFAPPPGEVQGWTHKRTNRIINSHEPVSEEETSNVRTDSLGDRGDTCLDLRTNITTTYYFLNWHEVSG